METTTLINEVLDARGNASYLTGIVMGMAKYNFDVSNRDKVFLLNQLIEAHSKYPIGNSERIISECNELLNNLQN
jgi:hypothetical protein